LRRKTFDFKSKLKQHFEKRRPVIAARKEEMQILMLVKILHDIDALEKKRTI
jgi:hypothetical protein